MKKLLIVLLAILPVIAFTSISYAAQSDGDKTITRLSVETGDKGYIKVAEGFTLPCQYNVVYFEIASHSGKGYLSMLLAAKMADKKISITYEKDASDICTLSHVAID